MIDQDFIIEIECKIKRVLSAMEVIKLHDMDELYDRKEIVEAIDKSIYKARPIDYAMAICRSNAMQKVQDVAHPSERVITDWMSAWNIAHDDDAPEDLKKKALDFLNKKR